MKIFEVITSRQFIRGFSDGALSTLGVVIGASSASTQVIIAAGIGGAMANGISNILGAYSAENVEGYLRLRGVEKAMVSRDLKNSTMHRSIRRRTLRVGALDGGGTVIGGLIPVFPYMAGIEGEALMISIITVIGLIAGIGIYLGKLSKRNLVYSALKMAAFAGAVAGIVYAIQSAIIPA